MNDQIFSRVRPINTMSVHSFLVVKKYGMILTSNFDKIMHASYRMRKAQKTREKKQNIKDLGACNWFKNYHVPAGIIVIRNTEKHGDR